jgi:hypothetical protein
MISRHLKILLLFLFALPYLSKASDINAFKFEVVKVCMEFINNDDSTYAKKAKGNFDGATVVKLKEYYDVLTNSGKKIDEIYNYKIANPALIEDIDKYMAFARKTVLSGGKGSSRKERMKKELSLLDNKLTDIRKQFIEENNLSDDNSSESPGKETQKTDITNTNAVQESGNNSFFSKITKFSPYLFTLLGLMLLGIYLNNKIKNKKYIPTEMEPNKISTNHNNTISDVELENKIRRILKEMMASDEFIQLFYNKLKKVDNNNKQKTNELSNISVNKNVTDINGQNKTQIEQKDNQEIQVIVKYARQADFTDGFRVDMLQADPDSYCIFEITIKENKATYKFNDIPATQEYAISSFEEYFRNTCTYDKLPNRKNTIKNDGNGKLELEGNKWKITEKAKLKII